MKLGGTRIQNKMEKKTNIDLKDKLTCMTENIKKYIKESHRRKINSAREK